MRDPPAGAASCDVPVPRNHFNPHIKPLPAAFMTVAPRTGHWQSSSGLQTQKPSLQSEQQLNRSKSKSILCTTCCLSCPPSEPAAPYLQTTISVPPWNLCWVSTGFDLSVPQAHSTNLWPVRKGSPAHQPLLRLLRLTSGPIKSPLVQEVCRRLEESCQALHRDTVVC